MFYRIKTESCFNRCIKSPVDAKINQPWDFKKFSSISMIPLPEIIMWVKKKNNCASVLEMLHLIKKKKKNAGPASLLITSPGFLCCF